MNGQISNYYQAGSYSTQTNGYELSPSVKSDKGPPSRTSAKALYGTEGIYFFRSSSKQKKKALDHFCVGPEDAMLTVDDGIRKLKLLDAKGKVWTQDMILQVDDKGVSLSDGASKLTKEQKSEAIVTGDGTNTPGIYSPDGKTRVYQVNLLEKSRPQLYTTEQHTLCDGEENELENFPVSSIQHCQAVTNACSYDSILALVCKEPTQSKADLHLFQCEEVKASLIQQDIDCAISDSKGGKQKRRPDALRMILRSDNKIPPPPRAPAPVPPGTVTQVDVRSRVAAWSAWASEYGEYEKPRLSQDYEETPEMIEARIDKDVQILNHILDDVEFFIMKLQKAAEAFSDLSKRKKTKKTKRKGPGEGVLTLRAKPPPHEEFVDCFQKLKHGFNLLAKLQSHIYNPSASDLVRFLLTPLNMMVESTGGPELASTVLSPLLIKDALDFLRSILNNEEKQFWLSLGDTWTKSRVEWPKDQFIPPYIPRFRNGWEPPMLNFGVQKEQELNHLAESVANVAELQRKKEMKRFSSEHPSSVPDYPPSDGYAFSNTVHKRGPLLDQGAAVAAFKQTVSRHVDRNLEAHGKAQPKKYAFCKYLFVARNSNELSVMKDDILEVIDDQKQWWKVRNSSGTVGFVPNNILSLVRSQEQGLGRTESAYNHTIQLLMPKKEFELFKQLLGELSEKQKTDYIPKRADPVPVAPSPPPPAPVPAPPLILAPVSVPALTPYSPGVISRQSSTSSDSGGSSLRDHQGYKQIPVDRRKSHMEEVQDELIHRLTIGRSAAQKKVHVPRPNVPVLNISYNSSAEDVKTWLQLKGFNPVTVTSLGVLTGAQLFSLTKDELKTVCPEGPRVYNQITVQKAALEEQSGSSELQEIMKKRQEKMNVAGSDSGVESLDEGNSH